MKLKIHAIGKQKNTLCYGLLHRNFICSKHHKKIHIKYPLHSIYQQKIYHDKQEIMYELFHQYHFPLLKYIDYPSLITQHKQNLDSDAHKKRNKATI